MTRPEKNWRFVKRALLLKGIAWLLGVSDFVVTRQAINTFPEPGFCFRTAHHDGPCNGFPARTCDGYAAWAEGTGIDAA